MTKVARKKNRKLRKQIRKTVGALFMASAIVVAAIPVQDVAANVDEKTTKVSLQHTQAADEFANPTVTDYKSSVPSANDSWVSGAEKMVYTTGDGMFQFTYMRPNQNDTNKYAVILGYNSVGSDNSTLTIPNELIAYKKYSENVSSEGYCLVSKNGEFLYYKDKEQRTDANGALLYQVYQLPDADGNPVDTTVNQYDINIRTKEDGTKVYIYKRDTGTTDETGNKIYEEVEYTLVPLMDDTYSPCYYEKKSEWEGIADDDLYYRVDPADDSYDNHVRAAADNNHWKIKATVAYIGNDVITSPTAGTWEVTTNKPSSGNGVFKNAGNVQHLTIAGNIWGIGDYAFSGCSNLQSVTLGDNLITIGNGAFANCIRLTECNVKPNARLEAIGKDAFYNCPTLSSFLVPVGTKALGDSCFEDCSSLQSISFGGDGGAVALTHMGDHVFKGCSALTGFEFPINYKENNLDIDMFEGCSSLQYIRIKNNDIDFNDDHSYDGSNGYPDCRDNTWESFIATVPVSFYLEGPDNPDAPPASSIHKTAIEESIPFKYLGQELYEKIEYEHDIVQDANTTNKSAKVTYQVNNNNELVKFWIADGARPDNVTIPETIGPYGISHIGAGSFNDNCDLLKITIPASVHSIGSNAFVGCHNLRTVIFTDATTIQSIDSNAFKTQDATCEHKNILNDPDKNMGQTSSSTDPAYPDDAPSLTFVGKMMDDQGQDTVPFIFAMNGASNINNAQQEKTWITYHSGWPTNLEVQYDYDPVSNTGEAMLINYPKYALIKDTASAKEWVESLPYVTSENMAEYKSMVLRATEYYQAPDSQKPNMQQPTENEMAIVNSSLNVVIPTNVDSIKPGLFSGFVPNEDDSDGSTEWDIVDNIRQSDGSVPPNIDDCSMPDRDILTVVLNGVKEIDPYTFKNCTSLREAAVIGPTYIDDYAFDGPTEEEILADINLKDGMALATVTLGTNLTDTGKRPFRGCESLTNITCLDSDFIYNNGILYRNTGSGLEIVQCLETRGLTGGVGSYSVGPEELVGVTDIKEEAFEDCDGVGQIDISQTTVQVIPERCFADTDDLNTVVFGDTVTNIEAESFRDSALRILTIPGNQVFIAQDAFATQAYLDSVEAGNENKDLQQTIIFECVEGMYADRYANEDEYWYINPEYGKVHLTHTVIFYDYPNYPDISEKVIYHKVDVINGEDAVPPSEPPVHEGYQFTRWTDYTNVTKDLDVYPIYGDNVYAVTFMDSEGNQIGETQYIEEGKSAIPPTPPLKDGYTFTGWSKDYNNITEDRTIIALYSDNSGDASKHTVIFYDFDGNEHSRQSVAHGEAAVAPKDPVKEGYTFLGWSPSDFSNVQKDMTIVSRFEKTGTGTGTGTNPNASASPTGTGTSSGKNSKSTPTPTPTPKKYTVSVSGGSGSGSYAAGEIVAINAYFRGTGQNFDKWTTSTAGVGFANESASSTTFTMPANNVAITATYKVGGATTTTSTGGGSSTGGTSTGSSNTNGSTVQITKPGISNTGLAGATVNGATDNFIVKVTEDQNATDAATAALQAKFGDISRIMYWPMDISLYDSTGRTKIADTSGISVNLTLPIPDELVQYAGNNKVAAVNGGVLEDLNTRFTTVNGVPCVNFTATHFSPYVIYVDTANLSAAAMDSTPKTGDPIHPKWFLSIGMACIAMILFFKRDKAVIPAKTA
ncbi:MAG: leucine-rich repeat protein [Lachnospiraceae bacterium]|nr:leucine-rich repeat protein [Lachnospiraceae bacterium]